MMAKAIVYEFMGARIEFVREGAWVARRAGDILHTLKGWQWEFDELNEPENHEPHLFEFVDYLAAERCIAHFARLEKAAA